MSPEGVNAPASGGGEPLADGWFRNAKRLGDRPLWPAVLLQDQRPHPPPLLPVLVGRVVGDHTPFYGRRKLKHSAQRSVIWKVTLPSPQAGLRGDPSDVARTQAKAAGSAPAAFLGDERRHAHPRGHRARRAQGKRATPALGLPGAAQAGGPETGEGEARPDPPGDRLGPRGVPAIGGR